MKKENYFKKFNRIMTFLVVVSTMLVTSVLGVSATTSDGGAITPSVTISGSAYVGETLTAVTTGIDTATMSVSYQWDQISADGATTTTVGTTSAYVIVKADVGTTLCVTVVATSNDASVDKITVTASTGVVGEVDADIATVVAAKTKVETAVFLDPTKESDFIDEAAVQAYITKLVTAAIDDSTVSVAVQKVSYVPQVNGTVDNTVGTVGSYEFTVVISKGLQSVTTSSRSIVLPAIAFVPTTYEVTSGASQTVTVGSSKTLSFSVSGQAEDFIGLYGNGVLVDASNYSVASDSLVITLSASYVKTLSVGDYEFTIVFTDGSASVDVKVKEVTTTTDDDDDDTTTTPSTTTATEEEVEETTEEVVEEETQEVVEEEIEDHEIEIDEAEQEEASVSEKDQVNMSMVWIILLAVFVVIVGEIIYVRSKKKE